MKKKASKKTKRGDPKERPPSNWVVAAVLAYVAVVLTVDTLAAQHVQWPFRWTVFQWEPATIGALFDVAMPAWVQTPPVNRVDLFKFVFWFLIPVAVCLPRMSWRWLSPHVWKRIDWWLLAGLIAAGTVAVVSVRYIPALRAIYPGMSHLPDDIKRTYRIGYLLWIVSWLPGWSFLHRYFLLRVVMRRFPRYGWLLTPLSETLYHLQKPLLEAGGMLVFSLVLTGWSVKRRNMLLPTLAHLYVEIALLVLLVFFM